jgi:small conductance mechanosensitive channel
MSIKQAPLRAVALLILLILISLVLPAALVAQDTRASVRVDGRAVLRVGPIDDEMDAAARAARIEQRINSLLENPQAIGPAQIEPSPDKPEHRVIVVSGVPIVTVTEIDAEDNLTSVEQLALQWSQAIDDTLQRAGAERQSPWGRFVAEVRGSVENAFASLGESLIVIIPRALAALLIFAIFWLVALIVRWLARVLLVRLIPDRTGQNLVQQVSYYIIWAIGIIVAIDAFGVDPQTLVAGLGLTGIALGFALRDIISNFVSGILILTLRPFSIGDQIIIGDAEGSVERIELRATQIRTYDGRRVLVPNAEVFTSRVTNNTAAPTRRASVEICIGYGTDINQALGLIKEATQTAPGVLSEPPVVVLVMELSAEVVTLQVHFWADSRRSDFLMTASAVRQIAVARLLAAGISLPEPSASVVDLRDNVDKSNAVSE